MNEPFDEKTLQEYAAAKRAAQVNKRTNSLLIIFGIGFGMALCIVAIFLLTGGQLPT